MVKQKLYEELFGEYTKLLIQIKEANKILSECPQVFIYKFDDIKALSDWHKALKKCLSQEQTKGPK